MKLPSLGPCCICEKTKGVRNILQIHRKGPTPGKGWGCVVCGLPFDGAVAVLCDHCYELMRDGKAALKFICTGYPKTDGRTPFEAEGFTPHDHDMTKHPEELCRRN